MGSDKISRDASPKQSEFEFFQARLLARDTENILGCSRIAFDYSTASFAEFVSEPDTTAGEHLHTWEQAPKYGNAHSLERELALAVDGYARCAVALRQRKRRVDRDKVRLGC